MVGFSTLDGLAWGSPCKAFPPRRFMLTSRGTSLCSVTFWSISCSLVVSSSSRSELPSLPLTEVALHVATFKVKEEVKVGEEVKVREEVGEEVGEEVSSSSTRSTSLTGTCPQPLGIYSAKVKGVRPSRGKGASPSVLGTKRGGRRRRPGSDCLSVGVARGNMDTRGRRDGRPFGGRRYCTLVHTPS